MKKCLLFLFVFSLINVNQLAAQVAVNTDGSSPDASAMLDVKSSSKGLLIPRMTTTQRNTLASTAVAGLMVYDTDLNKFFFFDGSLWREGSVGNLWSKSGSYTYLTNYSDRIGIGTSSPSSDIEINRTSGPAFYSAISSSGYAGLFIERASSNDNGYIVFKTAGTFNWFAGMIKDNNYAISTSYSAPDGKFYIESSGNVGIGTTSPARTLEVTGPWQTARLSSTSFGATLEFVSTVKDDWGITTWNGDMAFVFSSNDFASKTDEYYFTTSSIYPYTSNAKTLGTSTKRWSTLYSGVGNFSSSGTGISGATVYSVNTGTAGIAGYFESNGTDATMVLGQSGTGKFLKAFGPNGGNEEISIDNNGIIYMYNSSYVKTIQIAPFEGGGTTGGQISMYNSSGVETIAIDGDYSGDGRITTQELQITGGSDLSELFDLSDYEDIQKGMVVIIDENNPGSLRISQSAYDKKVAGIVSGANNIEPGLIMSQKGTIADGEHLIALSGRVYCMADASENPIKVGDMLTTSNVPGHAMKVMDSDKARGAIIGKAMTSLESGTGLVLVLVSLQ